MVFSKLAKVLSQDRRLDKVIRIGVKGKILTGEYQGWYIFVDPAIDAEDSDSPSFYIYYSTDFDFESKGEGYDDWVPEYKDVEGYFRLRNLEVEWLSESSEDDAK